jgi:hypothetical protein
MMWVDVVASMTEAAGPHTGSGVTSTCTLRLVPAVVSFVPRGMLSC